MSAKYVVEGVDNISAKKDIIIIFDPKNLNKSLDDMVEGEDYVIVDKNNVILDKSTKDIPDKKSSFFERRIGGQQFNIAMNRDRLNSICNHIKTTFLQYETTPILKQIVDHSDYLSTLETKYYSAGSDACKKRHIFNEICDYNESLCRTVLFEHRKYLRTIFVKNSDARTSLNKILAAYLGRKKSPLNS